MNVKKHRLVQTGCFLAAIALLWPPPFWTAASKSVVQLSAFVAICDSIAVRAVGLGSGVGLVFAAVAIFRRRWFCKYACPLGLVLDGAGAIGPKRTGWWRQCPPLGPFFAILTAAASVVGYPLLLWMDPLAIFSNSISLRTAGSLLSALAAVLGFGSLVLLSITSGPVWCARLCPLGGTLDLLASIKKALGAAFSSKSAQGLMSGSDGVRVHEGRRYFFFVAGGIAMGLLARRLGTARGEDAPLRPPGAVTESGFTGLCLRCGNCIRSCPARIIHPDLGRAGAAGLLAPVVHYRKSYCLEDCNACTKSCPSGALRSLELPEKRRYLIGEALMDGTLCVLVLGQRDCDACVRACPFDAVHIHWDEEQYIAYPVVDYARCNGCGACEVACPTSGDKAIRVWRKTN